VDSPSPDFLPALQTDTTLLQIQREAQQQLLLQPAEQQQRRQQWQLQQQQRQQRRKQRKQRRRQQQQRQQVRVDKASAGQSAQPAAATQEPHFGARSSNGSKAAASKCFVLVHMGPREVCSSDSYAAWCAGFGPAANHLFVSRFSQLDTTNRLAAELQAQLNIIEPGVFPLQLSEADRQQNMQQQQQQQQGTHSKREQHSTADGTACSSWGMNAADGVEFKLLPERSQGINMDATITQPIDLHAVQVRCALQWQGGWTDLQYKGSLLTPNSPVFLNCVVESGS
jgi:hypothetical protein